MDISSATARRLALYCQRLDGASGDLADKERIAQVIEQLGYIQIDTIHVIERAHHHVLWSRCPAYRPHILHELLVEDRRVFEWWTHAASYIPLSDFRFYAPRMGERALTAGQKRWCEENREVVDDVTARIRAEGALGAADFEAPEGFQGGTWWNWKPAKRALEILFNSGVVAVSERRNFQRLYDLRERVVPEDAHQPEPTKAEVDEFIIRRAVGSLGVLPEKEIAWWRTTRPTKRALGRATDAGLITPVTVEGKEDEPWYAWTAAIEAVSTNGSDPTALHILSPFDNLIIRRRWMERLFDFNYRLECYVPKAKRQYGYFVLPILYGDRFIGRMDSKADRSTRTLIVRRLIFEPEANLDDRVLPLLADKLRDFGAFNGCDSFSVEHVSPEWMKRPLTLALESPEYAAN